MANLFDEAREKQASASERLAGNVRALGGNLFDELAIKEGRLQDVSPAILQQQPTDESRRIAAELAEDQGILSTLGEFGRGISGAAVDVLRGVGAVIPQTAEEQAEQRALLERSRAARVGAGVVSQIPEQVEEFVGGVPRFARGLATGVETTTTGLGLGEIRTTEEQAVARQRADESLAETAGQVVGEAAGVAPFIIPTTVAVSRAPLAVRAGVQLLAGGLEGFAIGRGSGQSEGQQLAAAGIGGVVGGLVELFTPLFSRIGSALFSRLGRTPKGPLINPDGSATPELKQALTDSNTSFEDFTQEAVDELSRAPTGVDPAQAARAARLQSQGIPAVSSDITQDFSQQVETQRLLERTGSEAADDLRRVKAAQSRAFEENVTELVDSLGVPKDAGDNIKAALTGRKTLLRTEKNAFYKQAADSAPEVFEIPIITDNISEALPDSRTMRRLSRLAGNQIDALRGLLSEFGIKTPDDIGVEALEKITEAASDVELLNLGNFEDFRAALNLIERADTTGAASVAIGPIKNALDNEVGFIDAAIKEAGITDETILDILKKARARVRELKTVFSPQSITGRLIDVKRDGVTPVIEASKAANELLRPAAPIENLQRTLKVLSEAGDKGRRAIGDLQASTILNALENSLKASSRKTGGVPTIGGNQFAKVLSDLGDDKLDALFSNNPRALARLRGLKQTAIDIEPAAGAIQKGSAPSVQELLRIVRGFGRLPGVAPIVDVGTFVVKAGADDRAVRRAIKARPEFKRQITAIERAFPTIATALGVAGLVDKDGEE